MGATTILVVEDDEPIARALTGALQAQGYSVEWAESGVDALALIEVAQPALLLLDLGLPDLDGVDVCRQVRRHNPDVPIVILTARHGEIDVVLGLDAGADDYITKPFRLAELLARVRAHLRRPQDNAAESTIEIGDVRIERDARRAWVGERELNLRAKEFDLLAFLVSSAGNAVTRERIMSEVWDEHWFGSTKTLDMHVSALRRKLGDPDGNEGRSNRITTLRGVGYRFELP